jgi:ABC-type phosphate transport system substrate-binding protein
MFMYVAPTAKPEAEEFIKWVLSAPGQKLVMDTGYVPLEAFAPKDAK